MQFTEDRLSDIRTALLGPDGSALIHLMHLKGFGQDTSDAAPASLQLATDLRWIDPDSGVLTPLGTCAADSCREYQFWIERDRKTPFDGYAPHLSPAFFKGRKVLEIGPGMGANLMSIAAAGGEVLGVEPVTAYIQMGAILSEREGLAAPDVRQGAAEDIPFGNASADLILCASAHQYFEILPAFHEIARTLTKGGELLIVGGTFKPYFWGGLKAILQERSGAAAYVITVLNSLSYMAFKTRVIPARTGFSTSRPVYPSQAALMRLLSQTGFEQVSDPVKVGPETCLHVRLR